MEGASVYIPPDRRRALAGGHALAPQATGAVLFADISGFTPLTNALVAEFGARRGADELTRQLNVIYTALITEVERFGGSVIGFSGDAITCWFDAETATQSPTTEASDLKSATLRAVAGALAMQVVMAGFHALELDYGLAINMAIKTAIAAGPVRRILVGNDQIQLIDVLAGSTLDRMAATEQMAQKNELILDAPTLALVEGCVTIQTWRTQPNTGERYAVVAALQQAVDTCAIDHNSLVLAETAIRPWVLPTIYNRLQSEQGRFLAELRPATALFLRFEGLQYDQDDSAGDKLQRYIGWVQAQVDRYNGALIQLTTGDKGSYLYAAFGAPIAHDDDALRAVAVAQTLRISSAAFPFITTVQIGISQGLMRVGAYGSTTRRTYGVLGEETITAARLMSLAAPSQVVISQVVADAIADHYQLLDLGLVKLKGKTEPQPIFAVSGPRPHADERRTRLYATPLVGRSTELATMMQTMETVVAGQGHLLRIEGSAGVGKSHLVAHFVEQAKARAMEVAVAACQSTSQAITYYAGRQIARALFGLDQLVLPDEAAQIRAVEAAIDSLNPTWLLRMPLLGELLGLPMPDNPTTAAFDPKLRQEALISLAVEIAQTRAQAQPLLLLFEDVHWIDEASQGILLALARVVASAPMLLVLVQRPPTRENEPFLTEVAALPNQTYLPLDELSAEGVAALVRNRLGAPIAPLALSLISAQAQGNPFFTEELSDALIDANHLLPIDGVWTLSQALVRTLRDGDCLQQMNNEWVVKPDAPLATLALGIPNTIHGIVLARLDRLPEPVKLTLKVASVIGRIFAYDLLAQAHPVQRDVPMLSQYMETLLRRDFARLEAPEPRLCYIFKHNITQEVVYQTLLEDQLHELHQAVAEVMEHVRPEQIEDLAFHFYNADLRQTNVRGKALQYLAAAGSRAQHEYTNETALNYFNRALLLEERWAWLKAKIEILHILGRRSEERATLEQLADAADANEFEAALLWGEYYESISEYPQARQMIEWALGLAQSTQDVEGEARCYARLGMIAWRQGDYEAAEQAYSRSLGITQDVATLLAERSEAHYGLGLVYRQQGKYDEARTQLERDLMLNRQQANRQKEARVLNAFGNLAHLQRNFTQAITFYREALEIRQSIGDRVGIGASLFSLAQGLGNKGDHSQAEPLLNEALKIQQAINNRWWETLVWNELGILNFMVGRYAKAAGCLQKGLEICNETGNESSQSYILCNLGQVLRDQGNLNEAEQVLHTGLLMAQKQGDVNLEAIYYNDLAIICLYSHKFEMAIQYAQRSVEKFLSLGLKLSITSNLTTMASASLELGDTTSARNYVDETLGILNACEGDGPDFPQRDYWICYQILQYMGETMRAQDALTSAYRLLMQQAERISDLNMRASYLENVSFNRSIIEATN